MKGKAINVTMQFFSTKAFPVCCLPLLSFLQLLIKLIDQILIPVKVYHHGQSDSLLQPTPVIKIGKKLSGLLNFETVKVQPNLHKITDQI